MAGQNAAIVLSAKGCRMYSRTTLFLRQTLLKNQNLSRCQLHHHRAGVDMIRNRTDPGTSKALFVLAIICTSILLILCFMSKSEAEVLALYESHTWQEDFAATSEGPARYWPGDIAIEETSEQGPLGSSQLRDMIEYSSWSISERTGKSISYVGKTSEEGGYSSRKITFVWRTALEIFADRGSFSVMAYTRTWYYPSSGEIVGAIIYLNEDYFRSGADDCAIHTIMHEIVHAIGRDGHSNNDHDLMYRSNNHCRFSMSAADVADLPYENHSCYVELMRWNHLYIPNAYGKAAYLKYIGSNRWALDQFTDSDGSCSTASMNDAGFVTMTDVRGIDGKLTRVELRPIGDNKWALDYAE